MAAYARCKEREILGEVLLFFSRRQCDQYRRHLIGISAAAGRIALKRGLT